MGEFLPSHHTFTTCSGEHWPPSPSWPSWLLTLTARRTSPPSTASQSRLSVRRSDLSDNTPQSLHQHTLRHLTPHQYIMNQPLTPHQYIMNQPLTPHLLQFQPMFQSPPITLHLLQFQLMFQSPHIILPLLLFQLMFQSPPITLHLLQFQLMFQ